ncbi:dihydroflavonol-4-reductase [Mycobacterium shigaense]|uniref:Dihydroflavonol-4-reductase n=2 Tax=Mycobacterium shigaense TaxID=722731 RepID=A0A1Z4EFC2_9MYCO|nr:NAD-dependent epimerase/dehydratase family protein [Mycobacterium shigaense]MEA1122205.1 NAD-dependent epimerase/dehydratase family protein [Mycobacterium shigaense]PRI16388.1 epimerase [Mycobacterium shigaense]BAX91649.1 dihydroflavonol-4-reductase [Mycobacterium shigaense]
MVLVTGGSGYLGSWTIVELLRRGYHVRTTIRDIAREDLVRSMIATQTTAPDRLAFVQANLLEDAGWDQAAAGADFVLHVASPMPVGEYRGTDLVSPAVEGTRRVLHAARAAGVRRVVPTSSAEAAVPQKNSGRIAEETIWRDVSVTSSDEYARAKTVAEREAWSFAESVGDLELSTVLPCFMQGPVLGVDYSGSVDAVAMMLGGKLPAIPRIGWNIVDVRDIVELHLLAMTSPKALGERFIGSGEFFWLKDIAAILRDNLGARAKKVPRRTLPNTFVKAGALVSGLMQDLVPRLDNEQPVSSAKARRILGWTTRPAAISLLQTAQSLIELELV